LHQVEQELRSRASGIVALDQLDSKDKQRVIALSKLETYLGDDFIYKLGKPRRQPRPDEKQQHHRGWKPKHKRKKW
jgi:hypothetical protein